MRQVNKKVVRVRVKPNPSAPGESKVLMAARVSRTFHEWVQAECARREMSLQKLITSAVSAFIESRPDTNSADEGKPAHMFTLGLIDDEEDAQRRSNQRLWSTYQDKMPDEKIGVLVRAMKWDLLMKKSARRKGVGNRVNPKA